MGGERATVDVVRGHTRSSCMQMSMPGCDRTMSTSERRASILLYIACRNSSTWRAGP